MRTKVLLPAPPPPPPPQTLAAVRMAPSWVSDDVCRARNEAACHPRAAGCQSGAASHRVAGCKARPAGEQVPLRLALCSGADARHSLLILPVDVSSRLLSGALGMPPSCRRSVGTVAAPNGVAGPGGCPGRDKDAMRFLQHAKVGPLHSRCENGDLGPGWLPRRLRTRYCWRPQLRPFPVRRGARKKKCQTYYSLPRPHLLERWSDPAKTRMTADAPAGPSQVLSSKPVPGDDPPAPVMLLGTHVFSRPRPSSGASPIFIH